jgi:5-methylcytosine-specific restriction enzyme A
MPRKPPIHKPPRQPRPRDDRPSSAARGYDQRWRRLRAVHLAANPCCEDCLARGVTTQATVVDHVTSFRTDASLRLDAGNLRSLCARCHAVKTNSVDGGYGNPRR